MSLPPEDPHGGQSMALTPDGIEMLPGETLDQLDQGPYGLPVRVAPTAIEIVYPPRKYSWLNGGEDAPTTAGYHTAG